MKPLKAVFIFLLLVIWWTPQIPASIPLFPVPIQAQTTCSHSGLVAVDPPSVAGLGLQAGKNVTVKINVTNACPITAFAVALRYEPTVLKFLSIDQPTAQPDGSYSGTVLGSNTQVQHICVNGVAIAYLCSDLFDALGVISAAFYRLDFQLTPDPTNGLLLQVTFLVLKPGFSPFHLLESLLVNSVIGSQVPSETSDGYFSSITCPATSNILCTPPTVKLAVTPTPVLVGRLATFNITGSMSTNQHGFIQNVTWDWGDLTPVQTANRTVLAHVYSLPARYSSSIYSMTTTIMDNYNTSASVTVLVHVESFFIDLAVTVMAMNPQPNVYIGTQVQISASVVNNSTIPESANVTIALDTGLILLEEHLGPLAPQGGTASLGPVTWNTTGYAPRTYRIDAKVDPIKGENVTSNNSQSVYVQIISKPFDFTISAASPAPADPHIFAITNITIIPLEGLSGLVAVTDIVPPGLSCKPITPSSITGSGNATVSCSANTAGTYTLTVIGTSNSHTHSATAIFNYLVPDVSISESASSLRFNSGSSADATITVHSLNGFSDAVTLTVSAPLGISCSLDPISVQASGSSTLTCSSHAPSDYRIIITATGGATPHTTTLTVHVADAPLAAPSPVILGLAPVYFYSLTGAMVLLIIIGVTIFLTRRGALKI